MKSFISRFWLEHRFCEQSRTRIEISLWNETANRLLGSAFIVKSSRRNLPFEEEQKRLRRRCPVCVCAPVLRLIKWYSCYLFGKVTRWMNSDRIFRIKNKLHRLEKSILLLASATGKEILRKILSIDLRCFLMRCSNRCSLEPVIIQISEQPGGGGGGSAESLLIGILLI